MSLLDIFTKQENPFFTKLKKLNAKQNFAHRIERAFYLGGAVYTEESYKHLVNAISSRELGVFFENSSYDSQRDNMELYWIEDEKFQAKVLIILDSLELYHKEKILNTFPSNLDLLNSVIKKQQIYPNH